MSDFEDFFLIAEIISVFDSKGSVLINSYSDFDERFFSLNKIYIDVFGSMKEFFVEDFKILGKNLLLKLKNFDSDKDVEFLVGKKIFVDPENAVALPDNTYFIHDLIDCEVYREDKFFGFVRDVLRLPGNDVFVINSENGKEILIPAVKEFIKSFNSELNRLELTKATEIFDDDQN